MDEDRFDSEDSLDFFTQDGPELFAPAPAVPVVPPVEAEAPLALYRRYRPEVFGEVIGQDHVTEPLKRALAHNRVNHAYLFSGPRGCGKTSSARILARSLNCEQGPTPEPCGVCQSCRDLARGGPGSIDVIEIDAASHGGVDDARDLRERAFFAPVHSRYKIYIVDEAHMVSKEGFNALLKLVEEPPPHVKFIFATTEPDKVIGTIRSRTHHYPFRLIPPRTMTTFLTAICAEENVAVEPGVIPMVVRAGGGSVRDSLSILDQLFGGATDQGVGYAQAAALLGYTPDSLLDSVVDAIAASDSRGVFAGVDKVIETGQDPRRFAEDLLTRLRDLVIVAAVPDALSSGLLDVPDDQGERYTLQAKALGVGSLTRAAEVLAAGLVAMRGTTAPRLQLELMCARILLPGADAGERGIHARLERLERRLNVTDGGAEAVRADAGDDSTPGTTSASTSGGGAMDARTAGGGTAGGGTTGPAGTPSARTTGSPPAAAAGGTPVAGPGQPTRPAAPGRPDPREAPAPRRTGPGNGDTAGTFRPRGDWDKSGGPTTGRPQPPRPAAPARPVAELTTEDIRRSWPQILQRVSATRRYVWMILSQYATVTELRDAALWVTFSDTGARDNFNRSDGEDHLGKAILAELGATLLVRARLESEPIPVGGTAILSLAKTPPEVREAPGGPDVRPGEPDARPGADVPVSAGSAAPPRAGGSAPASHPVAGAAPAAALVPPGEAGAAPASRSGEAAPVPSPAVTPQDAAALVTPATPENRAIPAAPGTPASSATPDNPATHNAPVPAPRLATSPLDPMAQEDDEPSDDDTLGVLTAPQRPGRVNRAAIPEPDDPPEPDPDEDPDEPPPPVPTRSPASVRPPASVPSSAPVRPPSPAPSRAPAGPPTSTRPPRPAAIDPTDEPSEDDVVVDGAGNEAEDLVRELFDAELVKEETTKPRRRR